jgi:transposase-like protein
MTVNLTDMIFTDEEAARRHFEAIRWPDGPECPHCGVIGKATELKGNSTRPGVYKCRDCGKPFTAMIGTVYERSHIPLHKWLLATHLLCASKKGISAHQLWRMLGFGSYRTAWFMAHRIREGMREALPEGGLGGEGKVVEIDETYVGGKEANKHAHKRTNKGRGPVGKAPVISLVERDGSVRSFHVANVTATTLRPIIVTNVNRASHIMTDESAVYPKIGEEFAGHGAVNHSAEEYVRAYFWHTNTVENFFSIFKRGIYGVYHHVSETHLHRYATEFDFCYNRRASLGVDDATRASDAVKGIAGKRLTYRQPHGQARARP